MFVVTVTFSVSDADAGRFIERLKQHAQNSLTAEQGCQRFDVCLDPGTPGHVFLYEAYDDRAAFDLHTQTPHFEAFEADVAPIVVSKEVNTWTLA